LIVLVSVTAGLVRDELLMDRSMILPVFTCYSEAVL
jgi:hypothetical protein